MKRYFLSKNSVYTVKLILSIVIPNLKVKYFNSLLIKFLVYITVAFFTVVLTNIVYSLFYNYEQKLSSTFENIYLLPFIYYNIIVFISQIIFSKEKSQTIYLTLLILLTLHSLYYYIFFESFHTFIWEIDSTRGFGDTDRHIFPFMNYYFIPALYIFFIAKQKFTINTVLLIYWIYIIAVFLYFHLTNYYHWHGLRLDRIWNIFEFQFDSFYYQMKYALITQMLVLVFDLFTFRLLMKSSLNPNLKQLNG